MSLWVKEYLMTVVDMNVRRINSRSFKHHRVVVTIYIIRVMKKYSGRLYLSLYIRIYLSH